MANKMNKERNKVVSAVINLLNKDFGHHYKVRDVWKNYKPQKRKQNCENRLLTEKIAAFRKLIKNKLEGKTEDELKHILEALTTPF